MISRAGQDTLVPSSGMNMTTELNLAYSKNRCDSSRTCSLFGALWAEQSCRAPFLMKFGECAHNLFFLFLQIFAFSTAYALTLDQMT